MVLTCLLAWAQSGQLLLRLGDLDAIKDDDQNDDDQNDDDPQNHHLVINPPRALVISLKRVQLLLLKEISTPTPPVRKCALINSQHRKHTLKDPTFRILLN